MQKLLTGTVVSIPIVAITIVEVQLGVVGVPIAVHQVAVGPHYCAVSSFPPTLLLPKALCYSRSRGHCVASARYCIVYAQYDAGSFLKLCGKLSFLTLLRARNQLYSR